MLRSLPDQVFQILGIPSGALAAVLQADRRLRLAQQIKREVLHDGHIFRAMAGPQAGEIVAEHHVEHPMQPVLDAPMAAHRARKRFNIELG